MHINSLNHFRAVAIIFIVAGHCYGLASLEFNTLLEKTVRNLITGGTSFFVFISGFLFHHVFYKKFKYRTFIYSKFKNILIPYFILGIVPVTLYVLSKDNSYGGFFIQEGRGVLYEYLIPSIKFYWTGGFLIGYWYIPFIFVTFLLSPVYIYFIRARPRVQITVIILFSIVSIFLHRPVGNLSVLHSVIYFSPIYCIGIITSINRGKVYKFLAGKEIDMFFIVIMLALLEAKLGHVGNYHKSPLHCNGIDIIYFQKLIMCFFLLSFLNKFESYNNYFIHLLASTSFTIFFIHPFLIYIITNGNFIYLQGGSWFTYLAIVLIIIFISVVIAKTTRKLLPKYSRYIVGY